MTRKKTPELFQYVLILKKERPESINYISFLLCFISWLFFLFHVYVNESFSSSLFWTGWLIPIVLFRTVWQKRKSSPFLTYKYPLFVTGCVWLLVPGMRWIALLFILFIVFDHQARQPLEVGVSDERIVINTFFRKRYQWNELSNVVLNGGLLTLDFTNNKVLQREILHQDIDEAEFNDFCREQVDLRFKIYDL